jgi:hypothetical protein
MGPIFILGCGFRCGSTLLQRLLSSTGEVFIWGENHGMPGQLLEMRTRLSRWNKFNLRQWSRYETDGLNTWLANMNPREATTFTNAARGFLLDYYEEPTHQLGYPRWGFKEVRHGKDVAEFLLECFPHARIIYLIRNPQDVLASNSMTDWYSNIGGAFGVMDTWCRRIRDFLAHSDPRVLTVQYEDLLNTPSDAMTATLSHALVSRAWDHSLLQNIERGMNREPNLGTAELEALSHGDVAELWTLLYPERLSQ